MSGARTSPRGRGAWLLAMSAAAALALGVAACGDDEESGGGSSSSGGGDSGEKVTVGLITKTETNPFFVKMKEAAQKAADANNAELVERVGQDGPRQPEPGDGDGEHDHAGRQGHPDHPARSRRRSSRRSRRRVPRA